MDPFNPYSPFRFLIFYYSCVTWLYLCYTGEINEVSFPSELAVFEENYALLYNTIANINDLLINWFLEEKIFTINEEQTVAITTASAKVQLLLQKISTLLKAGNSTGFYIMLKVMKEHGDKGAQTLADHIMNTLKISGDKLPQLFSNKDVHVENDESKG